MANVRRYCTVLFVVRNVNKWCSQCAGAGVEASATDDDDDDGDDGNMQ